MTPTLYIGHKLKSAVSLEGLDVLFQHKFFSVKSPGKGWEGQVKKSEVIFQSSWSFPGLSSWPKVIICQHLFLPPTLISPSRPHQNNELFHKWYSQWALRVKDNTWQTQQPWVSPLPKPACLATSAVTCPFWTNPVQPFPLFSSTWLAQWYQLWRPHDSSLCRTWKVITKRRQSRSPERTSVTHNTASNPVIAHCGSFQLCCPSNHLFYIGS